MGEKNVMPVLEVPSYFDSAVDPETGQLTRLWFNKETGVINLLTAYQGSQQVFSLTPQTFSPMFTVSFVRYDLANLANNIPNQGVVDYPQPLEDSPVVEHSDANQLVFRFDKVKPVVGSPLPATDFTNIQVKISFKKPTDKAAAGWIDLDLEFDFPDAVKADTEGVYGWQTRLLYPDLRFSKSDIYSESDQTGYLLLDPLGKVESFYLAGLKANDAGVSNNPMPVPFAAIYQLATREKNIKTATGVALAAVDNYGNHKELYCYTTQGENLTSFSFRLIPPIYLNANQYVRPAHYKLSQGLKPPAGDTDKLFSGAGMHYRIRCFNLDGKLPGVPIDWCDVADLYRRWVKHSKVSTQFRKDVPHPLSPVVANMNPHTVAINYSLDGQIDPDPQTPVQNNSKIRTWLEVHPVTGEPDMSGNSNEPLPALLARLQSRIARWSAWENSGGSLASAPASSFRSPNRVDVFAIGSNRQLSYTSWDGTVWSLWKDLSKGVALNDRPASVSTDANRIDVFARDASGQVYHFYSKDKTWQPMEKLSYVAQALAVASSAAKRLDLFMLDASSQVQHTSSQDSGAWSALTNLGSPASVKLLSLAACSRQPNLLYVFALDNNGALWFRVRTAGSWDAGWSALGGTSKEMPTAVSWGVNRLDVFTRGTDDKLKHIFLDTTGVWSQWETLNSIDSSPSVLSSSANRLELFARSAKDGSLLHSFFDSRLEAQLWGFEMGGFYRFMAGLPPATNVINKNDTRFKEAMQALSDQGVLPSATTDPLTPSFNRTRFRGHLLLKPESSGTLKSKNRKSKDSAPTWVEAIGDPFPKTIETFLNPNPGDKPTSRGTTILLNAAGQTVNNRVFIINLAFTEYQAFDDSISARRGFDGRILTGAGILAAEYFATSIRSRCPVGQLEDAYIGTWLQAGLLAENFRLIESMKYHYSTDFCYDKSHNHLVEQPPPNYTNAIGYGPWHLQRLTHLFKRLQRFGTDNDKGRDAVFSLTFEFIPLENLVSLVDEFYERDCSTARMFIYTLPRTYTLPQDLIANSTSLALRTGAARLAERRVPVFHFIYSELITQKMDLADMDNLIHPGYREILSTQTASNPMLLAERDDDTADTTFAQWKTYCDTYCVKFQVDTANDGYGIAPRDYVTSNGGSYTYNRARAATFNLRSWVFRYGAAAVMGERIVLPAAWFEAPTEYYDEALNMGIRGAWMQMRFKEFFRSGYMLGQTQILTGNKALWAWRARTRNFSDVAELVKKVHVPPTDTTTTPPPVVLNDAISRGVDVEMISPPDAGNYQEFLKHALYNAFRITTDKIQHMVWCRDLPGNKRELLYVFANVGNRSNGGQNNDPKVKILYSRGFETGTGWKRIIYTFDAASNGTPNQPKDIKYNATEEMSMNPRSLKVIRIYGAG
jgi:hypothetical protein